MSLHLNWRRELIAWTAAMAVLPPLVCWGFMRFYLAASAEEMTTLFTEPSFYAGIGVFWMLGVIVVLVVRLIHTVGQRLDKQAHPAEEWILPPPRSRPYGRSPRLPAAIVR